MPSPGRTLTPVATPSVTSFTPTTGAPGTTVTVSGTGFTGVTGVTLGGIAASFTVHSDTQLLFTVPNAAAGADPLALLFEDTVSDPGAFAVTGGGNQPNPPTNLQASNISETGADLTWTASTGATQYTPQVNGQSLSPVTGTSATLSGLSPGTTYSVDVLASNTAGTSGPSKTLSVTTLGAGPPPPPPPAGGNELLPIAAGGALLALVVYLAMRKPSHAGR